MRVLSAAQLIASPLLSALNAVPSFGFDIDDYRYLDLGPLTLMLDQDHLSMSLRLL